jgi:hypothetical protein
VVTTPELLFPASLRELYEAFVVAVEAAGPAEQQFARTQVCYRLKRQFAWLTPLSASKCLLTLDMYAPHPDPIVDEIIEFRADKYTHQITVTGLNIIEAAQKNGWFVLARQWGAKEPIPSPNH